MKNPLPNKEIPNADTAAFIKTKLRYMENCIKWLEWYAGGESSKADTLSSIDSLIKHCQEIKAKI